MSIGSHIGKKSRQRERRLIKGFNFDFMGGEQQHMNSLDEDVGALSEESSDKQQHHSTRLMSTTKHAKGKRAHTKWRQLIEATRNKVMPFSRSQESNEADNATETNSNFTGDNVSVKQLDANLKRKLFAMKLDSQNVGSQPHAPVTLAGSNQVATTTAATTPTDEDKDIEKATGT